MGLGARTASVLITCGAGIVIAGDLAVSTPVDGGTECADQVGLFEKVMMIACEVPLARMAPRPRGP